MAGKVDRRVERTRQLLRDALVSLIREKGFAALSAQEIIDRANVGRATFYAHFDNKEDLLMTGLEGLRSSLKELQRRGLTREGPPRSDSLPSAASCSRTPTGTVMSSARWWATKQWACYSASSTG